MSFKRPARNDPLKTTLRKTPISSTFSREVVREMWNQDFTLHQYREYQNLYDGYFAHIYRELTTAACSGDSQIPDLTHDQVIEIARSLKSLPLTKREAAQAFSLSTGCTDTGRIDRAITLAAGLLVPLNFKSVGGARRGEVISWEENDCLRETVSKRVGIISKGPGISHTNATSCNSSWSFSKTFNARQLMGLAGFRIIWTSNLLDHLLIHDEDENVEIHIFHHVKVLENNLALENPIISQEVILETLDTLALLIPRTDRRVRKWYRKLQRSYTLDPGVLSLDYLRRENRSIDHFLIWGARLRKLKQAFDEHEPDGPLQWWRDDRKPVQWWTFWIAALVLSLTIIFGLIQSVTTIFQLTRA